MNGFVPLLQETGAPSVRAVIGELMRRSLAADFAVARIRLAAVDLVPSEVARIRRCRVLVGRLDANAIVPGSKADEHTLAALSSFVASGRAEIRSAAGASWLPDFSVFTLSSGGDGPRDAAAARSDLPVPGDAERRQEIGVTRDARPAVCLMGAHFFAPEAAITGPAFTAVLTDAHAVQQAAMRFELLWENGYDVAPVIASMLEAC
jgi:hypothetical protein